VKSGFGVEADGGSQHMQKRRLLARSAAACIFAVPASLAAQESPKEIIAAHIRSQGYECDAPQSAKRDLRASRPGEAVWLLKCADASYRVRLIPDMAAVVERTD
jgi:hypothetical protein